MTLDRSWEDEWAATWLKDRAYVAALDGWVRRRMVAHYAKADRSAVPESIGPWTIDGLVSDIREGQDPESGAQSSSNGWVSRHESAVMCSLWQCWLKRLISAATQAAPGNTVGCASRCNGTSR